MTEQDAADAIWATLLAVLPSQRHAVLAMVRERLDRMPVTLVNDAVMTKTDHVVVGEMEAS